MNEQGVIAVLAKMVAVVENLGDRTAQLISSGDPIDAIEEAPGSSAIAGAIRNEVTELRKLFDENFGDSVRNSI